MHSAAVKRLHQFAYISEVLFIEHDIFYDNDLQCRDKSE